MKTKILKNISKTTFIFFVVVFLSAAGQAKADTHTAASCSLAAVQAAHDLASDGDIVSIPAGNCSWSSSLKVSKGVTFQGTGIDVTMLNGSGELFSMTVSGNKSWRLSGFTMHGVSSGERGVITIEQAGKCANFRIDHVKSYNNTGRGIVILNDLTGVIDHCQFINNDAQNILIQPQNSSMTTSWTTETHFGWPDAVFIEDNIFNNASDYVTGVDSVFGAKYVFRHNTLTNVTVLDHGYEMERSGLKMEIYNNTFTGTGAWSMNMPAISIRGGTALIYNNTITGGASNYWIPLYLSDYPTCYGVGAPNGSFSGSHIARCMTYPCMDQVGRTYNQILSPLYQWNNTWNGQTVTALVNDMGSSCINPSVADHIQKGRDYYDNVQFSYTPYQYPHPLVSGSQPTCAIKGDANSDGSINISDVQTCINVILGTDTTHKTCSDMNGNSTLDITDCQAIINKILNP